MSAKKRKFDEISSDESEQETTAEEQVLSHAAQRRLQKRLKTVVTDNATGEKGGPAASIATRTNNSNPGVHSIWVGNLAFKTTPDALKGFLGNMEDIKRIHMPTKALHGTHSNTKGARGDNRGFAYVDFATAEAKEAAIAKSEGHLDGRRLLIKDGNDFAGRPEKDGGTGRTLNPLTGLTKMAKKILSQQKNPACATLFLGNLGFETKEEEIAALFGRLHPKLAKREIEPEVNAEMDHLLRVRMGTFEDSGKCKGFAFVDFKDQQFATDALTNPHNHSLNGRALIVEYASADAVRRGVLANAKKGNEKLPTKNHSSRRPQKSERIAAKATARQSLASENGTKADDSGERSIPLDTGFDENSKVKDSRKARDGLNAYPPRRQKSGAALAIAQREKVSIVPSTGKKIVF